MAEPDKDAAILQVIIERFEKQRLPRLQDMQERVEKGEILDDWDTEFLDDVLDTAREIKPMIDERPEYQGFYARAVHLYNRITEKALENAKGTEGSA